MKRILFLLVGFVFMMQTAFSQNPKLVYASSKDAVHLDLPAIRSVAGGTIINVVYSNSNFPILAKGAFEYACKLVEECIPTVCPLKFKVEFSKDLPAGTLASVADFSADFGDSDYDKVYAKRYVQTYGIKDFSDSEKGLAFYRDSEDAVIQFSSNVNYSYSIDPSNIDLSEYDFVTVAMQAIIKAVGFTCNAYMSGNELYELSPTNRFTAVLLSNNPSKNYQLATSGNAYMTNYLETEKWLLVSNAPYRSGISLNYLDEKNGESTSIMQYGISPGSYIRNIGTFMKTFFSFCGWDRDVLVGTGSSLSIEGASSDNIIAYVGMNGKSNIPEAKLVESSGNIDLNTYLGSVRETGEVGNYVLLYDGTWRKYDNLCELTDTNSYARTVDGCLRLKDISKVSGPNGAYANWRIKYKLYSYLPRKAEAQMIGYKVSADSKLASLARRNAPRASVNDTYIDVTIGMKNLEGTDYVIVEQTDADYPIPFTYIIDNPKTGSFEAQMNKKYASTFKLSYVNANGKTVGDPFTVKVKDVPSQVGDVELKLNGNSIAYKVNDHGQEIRYHYFIRNLDNGVGSKQGDITQLEGNINISSLPMGSYVIDVYGYVPSMIRVAHMTWFNRKWNI